MKIQKENYLKRLLPVSVKNGAKSGMVTLKCGTISVVTKRVSWEELRIEKEVGIKTLCCIVSVVYVSPNTGSDCVFFQ
jgi:hypothetical protein